MTADPKCVQPDAPIVPCAHCEEPVHTCERSEDDPRVGGWQEPGTPLPEGKAGDKIEARGGRTWGWYPPDADCDYAGWSSGRWGSTYPAGADSLKVWRWVIYNGQPVQAHYDSTCPAHPGGMHEDGDRYEDWPPGGHWFCSGPCARAFIAEWRLEQAHAVLDGLGVDRNRTDHGAWQEVGISPVPLPAKLDDRIAVRTGRWGKVEIVAGEITDGFGRRLTWMREKGGEPLPLAPGDTWRWMVRDGVRTNDPMEGADPIPLDERIKEGLKMQMDNRERAKTPPAPVPDRVLVKRALDRAAAALPYASIKDVRRRIEGGVRWLHPNDAADWLRGRANFDPMLEDDGDSDAYLTGTPPHDGPEGCYTYCDGCHCTVATLERSEKLSQGYRKQIDDAHYALDCAGVVIRPAAGAKHDENVADFDLVERIEALSRMPRKTAPRAARNYSPEDNRAHNRELLADLFDAVRVVVEEALRKVECESLDRWRASDKEVDRD